MKFWALSTKNKKIFLPLLSLLLLASCDSYESPGKAEIRPREEQTFESQEAEEGLQINGLYETQRACKMYEEADEKTAFDDLEGGSPVKILGQEEGAFVYVDYFGNKGYVKVSDLKD